jgi:hypothetical protein
MTGISKRWSKVLAYVCLLSLVAAIGLLVLSYGALSKNRPSIDIDTEADTLELVGQPGETVAFNIVFHPFNNEYWRSSYGVSIIVGGKEQWVVAPRDQSWPSQLAANDSDIGAKEVGAKFTIPAEAKMGQALKGHLNGVITYPTDVGNGQYDAAEVQIRNPVEVQLVNRRQYEASRRQLGTFELWSALAAGIVFAASMFFAILLSPRRTAGRADTAASREPL